MGFGTSRVKPPSRQTHAGPSVVDNAESRPTTGSTPPGPIISYAQLQRELHHQATQRKPTSPLSSTTASSSSSPPSQYSISKLEAFDDFHNRASLVHGIAILLATPMPCLAIMLALESIPLVSPALGREANHMYFERMFFATLAIAMSVAIECQEFIPETQLTWRYLCLIAFCQAVTFVGTLIGISVAAGVFPVPYSLVVAIGPAISVADPAGRAAGDRRVPRLRDRVPAAVVTRPDLVLAAAPSCQVRTARSAPAEDANPDGRGGHDVCVGPLVPHTVHCHVLAECEDPCNGGLHSRVERRERSEELLQDGLLREEEPDTSTSDDALCSNVSNAIIGAPVERSRRATSNENVAKRALALAGHPQVIARLLRSDPSVVVSSYHRYSSPKWIAKHQELVLKQHKNSACEAGRVTLQRSAASERACRISASIRVFLRETPAEVLLNARLDVVPRKSASVATSSTPVSEALNVKEVQDTLAILHANEICLLHSYVSGMVYLVYGIYVRVVFSLPNREFITAMMRVMSEREVASTIRIIYILYSVELLIMVAYFVVIRWALCVPSIRQLAFILYSQRWIVQPKLIVVTVVIFAFPIMHTGDAATL